SASPHFRCSRPQRGASLAAAPNFAAKLAPRWGRLHLKWGEALAKLGKADEAQGKWRAATGMDLSPAGRARVTGLLQKQTT
ncbi:hypothetical protein, partial [Phenylobacterium sp.]|uniref:hypothetical protein n=1 Tax=Phenylobacterium sp. TaxID=1871053 RepID=UPI003982D9D5